jgi:hypothetical protein
MKKCVLAILMLTMTAPTLAAAEGKVVQVIFIGRDEISGDLTYDQFDETGAARRCVFSVNPHSRNLVELICTKWAIARRD